MNKENNKSAGLRRSAVAERLRLREEWSALKGPAEVLKPSTNVLAKRVRNGNVTDKKQTTAAKPAKPTQVSGDVLRGVVALVEVGAEPRALPLRAALTALGATVVPSWSPLVTHLVWAQGGCRATRAEARALACRLVCPLWVQACAAAARRLPEQTFPTAARPSDLPSPRTLRRLLKQAEIDNVPLANLLSDSHDKDGKATRLRRSSVTERDTSSDNSTDTSHDTAGVASRVNTAPRLMAPACTPPPPRRSRRKLFTQKEAAETDEDADETEDEPSYMAAKRAQSSKLTQRDKKNLLRAERMARRIVAARSPARPAGGSALPAPTIVVTGMSKSERHIVCDAVRALGGRLRARVGRRTTHVLLGSCRDDTDAVTSCTEANTTNQTQLPSCEGKARTLSALAGAARGCRVLRAQWAVDSRAAGSWRHHHRYEVPHLMKLQQKACIERSALGRVRKEYAYDVFNRMRVRLGSRVANRDAAVELLILCGAIVLDHNGGLVGNGAWSQDGGLTHNGLQRHGATRKNGVGLTQRGGVARNGGIQDSGVLTADCDITIGSDPGEISSKWVFDSVAAARIRSTRRYVI